MDFDFDFLGSVGTSEGFTIFEEEEINEIEIEEVEPVQFESPKKVVKVEVTAEQNKEQVITTSSTKKRKKTVFEIVKAGVEQSKHRDFSTRSKELFPEVRQESVKRDTFKAIWDQVKSLKFHPISMRRQRKSTEAIGENYNTNYDLVMMKRDLIKKWYPLTCELSEDQKLRLLRVLNQEDWNRRVLNEFNETINAKIIKLIEDKSEEELARWKDLNRWRYEVQSYQAISEIPLPKKRKKGEEKDQDPYLLENKRILDQAKANADRYLIDNSIRQNYDEDSPFKPIPVEMELAWTGVGIAPLVTTLLELLGVKRDEVLEKSAIQVYVENYVPEILKQNPVAIFAKLLWDHKTKSLEIFQDVSKKTIDQIAERYVPQQAINTFKDRYDLQNEELILVGEELKIYVRTKEDGKDISVAESLPPDVQKVFWKIYKDIENSLRAINLESEVTTQELKEDFYKLYKTLSRLIKCNQVTLSLVEVVIPSPIGNKVTINPLPLPVSIVSDRIQSLEHIKYASDPHPTGAMRRTPEKITLINIPHVLQRTVNNIITVLRPSNVENVICYVDWADLAQPLRNQLSQPDFNQFFRVIYPHDYEAYTKLQSQAGLIYNQIKRLIKLDQSTESLKRQLEELQKKINVILLPKKEAFDIHLENLIHEGFAVKDLVWNKFGQITQKKGGLYFSILDKSFIMAERYKLPGSGNAAVSILGGLRKWGIHKINDYILGVGEDHIPKLLALYEEYLAQDEYTAKEFIKQQLIQLAICPIGIDKEFQKYLGIELEERLDPGTKSQRIFIKQDNRPTHHSNVSRSTKNNESANKRLLVYSGLTQDLKDPDWKEKLKLERKLQKEKAKTK